MTASPLFRTGETLSSLSASAAANAHDVTNSSRSSSNNAAPDPFGTHLDSRDSHLACDTTGETGVPAIDSAASACNSTASIEHISPPPAVDIEELLGSIEFIDSADIPLLVNLLHRSLYCVGDEPACRAWHELLASSSPASTSYALIQKHKQESSAFAGAILPANCRSHSTAFTALLAEDATAAPPSGVIGAAERGESSSTKLSSTSSTSSWTDVGSNNSTSSWNSSKSSTASGIRRRRGRAWLREAAALSACSCLRLHEQLRSEDSGGGVCGAQLSPSQLAFRCLDCEHDSTCVVCAPCFLNGNHKDHYYFMIQASGGCCDCGDLSSWKFEGFCDKHQGTSIHTDGPAALLCISATTPLKDSNTEKNATSPPTQKSPHEGSSNKAKTHRSTHSCHSSNENCNSCGKPKCESGINKGIKQDSQATVEKRSSSTASSSQSSSGANGSIGAYVGEANSLRQKNCAPNSTKNSSSSSSNCSSSSSSNSSSSSRSRKSSSGGVFFPFPSPTSGFVTTTTTTERGVGANLVDCCCIRTTAAAAVGAASVTTVEDLRELAVCEEEVEEDDDEKEEGEDGEAEREERERQQAQLRMRAQLLIAKCVSFVTSRLRKEPLELHAAARRRSSLARLLALRLQQLQQINSTAAVATTAPRLSPVALPGGEFRSPATPPATTATSAATATTAAAGGGGGGTQALARVLLQQERARLYSPRELLFHAAAAQAAVAVQHGRPPPPHEAFPVTAATAAAPRQRSLSNMRMHSESLGQQEEEAAQLSRTPAVPVSRSSNNSTQHQQREQSECHHQLPQRADFADAAVGHRNRTSSSSDNNSQNTTTTQRAVVLPFPTISPRVLAAESASATAAEEHIGEAVENASGQLRQELRTRLVPATVAALAAAAVSENGFDSAAVTLAGVAAASAAFSRLERAAALSEALQHQQNLQRPTTQSLAGSSAVNHSSASSDNSGANGSSSTIAIRGNSNRRMRPAWLLSGGRVESRTERQPASGAGATQPPTVEQPIVAFRTENATDAGASADSERYNNMLQMLWSAPYPDSYAATLALFYREHVLGVPPFSTTAAAAATGTTPATGAREQAERPTTVPMQQQQNRLGFRHRAQQEQGASAAAAATTTTGAVTERLDISGQQTDSLRETAAAAAAVGLLSAAAASSIEALQTQAVIAWLHDLASNNYGYRWLVISSLTSSTLERWICEHAAQKQQVQQQLHNFYLLLFASPTFKKRFAKVLVKNYARVAKGSPSEDRYAGLTHMEDVESYDLGSLTVQLLTVSELAEMAVWEQQLLLQGTRVLREAPRMRSPQVVELLSLGLSFYVPELQAPERRVLQDFVYALSEAAVCRRALKSSPRVVCRVLQPLWCYMLEVHRCNVQARYTREHVMYEMLSQWQNACVLELQLLSAVKNLAYECRGAEVKSLSDALPVLASMLPVLLRLPALPSARPAAVAASFHAPLPRAFVMCLSPDVLRAAVKDPCAASHLQVLSLFPAQLLLLLLREGVNTLLFAAAVRCGYWVRNGGALMREQLRGYETGMRAALDLAAVQLSLLLLAHRQKYALAAALTAAVQFPTPRKKPLPASLLSPSPPLILTNTNTNSAQPHNFQQSSATTQPLCFSTQRPLTPCSSASQQRNGSASSTTTTALHSRTTTTTIPSANSTTPTTTVMRAQERPESVAAIQSVQGNEENEEFSSLQIQQQWPLQQRASSSTNQRGVPSPQVVVEEGNEEDEESAAAAATPITTSSSRLVPEATTLPPSNSPILPAGSSFLRESWWVPSSRRLRWLPPNNNDSVAPLVAGLDSPAAAAGAAAVTTTTTPATTTTTTTITTTITSSNSNSSSSGSGSSSNSSSDSNNRGNSSSSISSHSRRTPTVGVASSGGTTITTTRSFLGWVVDEESGWWRSSERGRADRRSGAFSLRQKKVSDIEVQKNVKDAESVLQWLPPAAALFTAFFADELPLSRKAIVGATPPSSLQQQQQQSEQLHISSRYHRWPSSYLGAVLASRSASTVVAALSLPPQQTADPPRSSSTPSTSTSNTSSNSSSIRVISNNGTQSWGDGTTAAAIDNVQNSSSAAAAASSGSAAASTTTPLFFAANDAAASCMDSTAASANDAAQHLDFCRRAEAPFFPAATDPATEEELSSNRRRATAACEEILAHHQLLLEKAAAKERVWTPTAADLDSTAVAVEFYILEFWRIACSCVCSLFFLERMNLHRVTAREKYLKRYPFLLRRQVLHLLAIHRCSASQLEKAVGRSSYAHPDFPAILEEVAFTPFSAEQQRQGDYRNFCVDNGARQMQRYGFSNNSLLRLRPSSWLAFDAFSASHRCIAGGISSKRDQLPLSPGDLQVAEEEALKNADAPLLWPWREDPLEPQKQKEREEKGMDEQQPRGEEKSQQQQVGVKTGWEEVRHRQMSDEFFEMQDLLVNALVVQDPNHLLLRLALQLLRAKNANCRSAAASTLRKTTARSGATSDEETSDYDDESRESRIGAPGCVRSLPQQRGREQQQQRRDAAAAAAAGAFLNEAVCSVLKLLDALVQANRSVLDQAAAPSAVREAAAAAVVVQSSSFTSTNNEHTTKPSKNDYAQTPVSDNTNNSCTYEALHNNNNKTESENKRLSRAEDPHSYYFSTSSSSTSATRKNSSSDKRSDSTSTDDGQQPEIPTSHSSDSDGAKGLLQQQHDRNNNEQKNSASNTTPTSPPGSLSGGVSQYGSCGAIPASLLPLLRAEIELLQQEESTFPEVRRYCRTLLQRIAARLQRQRVSTSSTSNDGTEQKLPLRLQLAAESSQSPQPSEQQKKQVDDEQQRLIFLRDRAGATLAEKPPISAFCAAEAAATADDDNETERASREAATAAALAAATAVGQSSNSSSSSGTAGAKELRGCGVSRGEGARKQQEILLEMQQRQREFVAFLNAADESSDDDSSDDREDKAAGGRGSRNAADFQHKQARRDTAASSCSLQQQQQATAGAPVVGNAGTTPGAPVLFPCAEERSRGHSAASAAVAAPTSATAGSRDSSRSDKSSRKSRHESPVAVTGGPAALGGGTGQQKQTQKQQHPVDERGSASAAAAAGPAAVVVLSRAEKAMRCSICLGSYSVARPLALLGRLSHGNILRRLAAAGKGNFPAKTPVLHACGHAAHIACMRQLLQHRANPSAAVGGGATTTATETPFSTASAGAQRRRQRQAPNRSRRSAGRFLDGVPAAGRGGDGEPPAAAGQGEFTVEGRWSEERLTRGRATLPRNNSSSNRRRGTDVSFNCPICRRAANCFLLYIPRSALRVSSGFLGPLLWPTFDLHHSQQRQQQFELILNKCPKNKQLNTQRLPVESRTTQATTATEGADSQQHQQQVSHQQHLIESEEEDETSFPVSPSRSLKIRTHMPLKPSKINNNAGQELRMCSCCSRDSFWGCWCAAGSLSSSQSDAEQPQQQQTQRGLHKAPATTTSNFTEKDEEEPPQPNSKRFKTSSSLDPRRLSSVEHFLLQSAGGKRPAKKKLQRRRPIKQRSSSLSGDLSTVLEQKHFNSGRSACTELVSVCSSSESKDTLEKRKQLLRPHPVSAAWYGVWRAYIGDLVGRPSSQSQQQQSRSPILTDAVLPTAAVECRGETGPTTTVRSRRETAVSTTRLSSRETASAFKSREDRELEATVEAVDGAAASPAVVVEVSAGLLLERDGSRGSYRGSDFYPNDTAADTEAEEAGWLLRESAATERNGTSSNNSNTLRCTSSSSSSSVLGSSSTASGSGWGNRRRESADFFVSLEGAVEKGLEEVLAAAAAARTGSLCGTCEFKHRLFRVYGAKPGTAHANKNKEKKTPASTTLATTAAAAKRTTEQLQRVLLPRETEVQQLLMRRKNGGLFSPETFIEAWRSIVAIADICWTACPEPRMSVSENNATGPSVQLPLSIVRLREPYEQHRLPFQPGPANVTCQLEQLAPHKQVILHDFFVSGAFVCCRYPRARVGISAAVSKSAGTSNKNSDGPSTNAATAATEVANSASAPKNGNERLSLCTAKKTSAAFAARAAAAEKEVCEFCGGSSGHQLYWESKMVRITARKNSPYYRYSFLPPVLPRYAASLCCLMPNKKKAVFSVLKTAAGAASASVAIDSVVQVASTSSTGIAVENAFTSSSSSSTSEKKKQCVCWTAEELGAWRAAGAGAHAEALEWCTYTSVLISSGLPQYAALFKRFGGNIGEQEDGDPGVCALGDSGMWVQLVRNAFLADALPFRCYSFLEDITRVAYWAASNRFPRSWLELLYKPLNKQQQQPPPRAPSLSSHSQTASALPSKKRLNAAQLQKEKNRQKLRQGDGKGGIRAAVLLRRRGREEEVAHHRRSSAVCRERRSFDDSKEQNSSSSGVVSADCDDEQVVAEALHNVVVVEDSAARTRGALPLTAVASAAEVAAAATAQRSVSLSSHRAERAATATLLHNTTTDAEASSPFFRRNLQPVSSERQAHTTIEGADSENEVEASERRRSNRRRPLLLATTPHRGGAGALPSTFFSTTSSTTITAGAAAAVSSPPSHSQLICATAAAADSHLHVETGAADAGANIANFGGDGGGGRVVATAEETTHTLQALQLLQQRRQDWNWLPPYVHWNPVTGAAVSPAKPFFAQKRKSAAEGSRGSRGRWRQETQRRAAIEKPQHNSRSSPNNSRERLLLRLRGFWKGPATTTAPPPSSSTTENGERQKKSKKSVRRGEEEAATAAGFLLRHQRLEQQQRGEEGSSSDLLLQQQSTAAIERPNKNGGDQGRKRSPRSCSSNSSSSSRKGRVVRPDSSLALAPSEQQDGFDDDSSNNNNAESTSKNNTNSSSSSNSEATNIVFSKPSSQQRTRSSCSLLLAHQAPLVNAGQKSTLVLSSSPQLSEQSNRQQKRGMSAAGGCGATAATTTVSKAGSIAAVGQRRSSSSELGRVAALQNQRKITSSGTLLHTLHTGCETSVASVTPTEKPTTASLFWREAPSHRRRQRRQQRGRGCRTIWRGKGCRSGRNVVGSPQQLQGLQPNGRDASVALSNCGRQQLHQPEAEEETNEEEKEEEEEEEEEPDAACANLRALETLRLEEELKVWKLCARRGAALFSPWACDVKQEFLKAFLSRVVQTPHQIRRRLRELMCIRALQLMDEVLTEEAGRVFQSQNSVRSLGDAALFSVPGDGQTAESPALPAAAGAVFAAVTAAFRRAKALHTNKTDPTATGAATAGALPTVNSPLQGHQFGAFYREWLLPWQQSGDLPRDLHKALPWYGFTFSNRNLCCCCSRAAGAASGALQMTTATDAARVDEEAAVIRKKSGVALSARSGGKAVIHKGEEDELAVQDSRVCVCASSSPPAISSGSRVNHVSSQSFSTSTESAGFSEDVAKKQGVGDHRRMVCYSVKRGKALVSSNTRTQAAAAAAAAGPSLALGLDWIYQICPQLLAPFSMALAEDEAPPLSDSAAASSSRILQTWQQQVLLPGTKKTATVATGGLALLHSLYNTSNSASLFQSKTGAALLLDNEEDSSYCSEDFACWGAATAAYTGPDRMHRLEKLLKEAELQQQFWQTLAARLPEKPSLLQLLFDYPSCMRCSSSSFTKKSCNSSDSSNSSSSFMGQGSRSSCASESAALKQSQPKHEGRRSRASKLNHEEGLWKEGDCQASQPHRQHEREKKTLRLLLRQEGECLPQLFEFIVRQLMQKQLLRYRLDCPACTAAKRKKTLLQTCGAGIFGAVADVGLAAEVLGKQNETADLLQLVEQRPSELVQQQSTGAYGEQQQKQQGRPLHGVCDSTNTSVSHEGEKHKVMWLLADETENLGATKRTGCCSCSISPAEKNSTAYEGEKSPFSPAADTDIAAAAGAELFPVSPDCVRMHMAATTTTIPPRGRATRLASKKRASPSRDGIALAAAEAGSISAMAAARRPLVDTACVSGSAVNARQTPFASWAPSSCSAAAEATTQGRRWLSPDASEEVVLEYVQRLWRQYETRLINGLCSFLRFAVYLIAAIWKLPDSAAADLLHAQPRINGSSSSISSATSEKESAEQQQQQQQQQRKELVVLLSVLGLPLHFEQQENNNQTEDSTFLKAAAADSAGAWADTERGRSKSRTEEPPDFSSMTDLSCRTGKSSTDILSSTPNRICQGIVSSIRKKEAAGDDMSSCGNATTMVAVHDEKTIEKVPAKSSLFGAAKRVKLSTHTDSSAAASPAAAAAVVVDGSVSADEAVVATRCNSAKKSPFASKGTTSSSLAVATVATAGAVSGSSQAVSGAVGAHLRPKLLQAAADTWKSMSGDGVRRKTQKSHRSTFLRKITRLMFSAAIVEGASTLRKRKVEIEPPCTDNMHLLKLQLPPDFLQLLKTTLLRKCAHCGKTPEQRAFCLLCGALLCLGSSCCKEEKSSNRETAWGECMLHAHTCGGGSGLFMLLQQSLVLAIDGTGWLPVEGVYVDSKGETEPHLRRGFGSLRLHIEAADRLSWLYMNGQLFFANRSSARLYPLSDLAVRWP